MLIRAQMVFMLFRLGAYVRKCTYREQRFYGEHHAVKVRRRGAAGDQHDEHHSLDSNSAFINRHPEQICARQCANLRRI